ncbi:MAG: hypothetical protein MK078_01280 [Crocinitomicaceae bacterium]|nr:hypothetical protein [Crocinitomicaceae bacterium]
MIKTGFILVLTVVIIFFALNFASSYFDIPAREIYAWTGILFCAFIIEQIIKYFLMLPFKSYFKDVQKHVLARTVQRSGISLSYISLWVAIGFTPVNGIVKGNMPENLISNPLFIKIAVVLLLGTILFSLLWLLSLKIKK